LLAPPETTSSEVSGVPTMFTPPDDIFDVLERDNEVTVVQEQQKLQMQQAHAAEPDPAAAMTNVCQLEESDWMVQDFLQAYHFQLPCLMC
jgi:hypothetical protein